MANRRRCAGWLVGWASICCCADPWCDGTGGERSDDAIAEALEGSSTFRAGLADELRTRTRKLKRDAQSIRVRKQLLPLVIEFALDSPTCSESDRQQYLALVRDQNNRK